MGDPKWDGKTGSWNGNKRLDGILEADDARDMLGEGDDESTRSPQVRHDLREVRLGGYLINSFTLA